MSVQQSMNKFARGFRYLDVFMSRNRNVLRGLKKFVQLNMKSSAKKFGSLYVELKRKRNARMWLNRVVSRCQLFQVQAMGTGQQERLMIMAKTRNISVLSRKLSTNCRKKTRSTRH